MAKKFGKKSGQTRNTAKRTQSASTTRTSTSTPVEPKPTPPTQTRKNSPTSPAQQPKPSKSPVPASARNRVVIDRVTPAVDRHAFPVKRVTGERVDVAADLLCDGHDTIAAEILHRHEGDQRWKTTPLKPGINDLWEGHFEVGDIGHSEYTIRAWVDRFGSWASDMAKRIAADQNITTDLKIGAALIREAATQASNGPVTDPDFPELGDDNAPAPSDAKELEALAKRMDAAEDAATDEALSDRVRHLMHRYLPRPNITTLDQPIRIRVDRHKALFSTWYEMFPRSAGTEPGKHGTFNDLQQRLPYIADMGFDVLYLPPIHPIGTTFRKGPNNSPTAGPNDPGSCWAIGSEHGGHTAVHPQLGTLEDFDELVKAADKLGIEIALDIAFQCSPDHPWVKEHPGWFKHRPDGTIQYAENPPKKYQDIYPLDFECDDIEALWNELKAVFEFWIARGVTIFRVDNPHTKSFPFWEWVIPELQKDHPDTIFLAEAFTRPKRMNRLAKGGFTQSYTYFAWRNGPHDIEQYMYDLTRTEVAEYFRPNFWPNTPDILTEYLQQGGRPAGIARLVLAATLSSSYGIYGPAYELMDYTPVKAGSEESLNSEKYQLRHWNLDNPWSLAPFIGLINRIRRENPALQQTRNINFHWCSNPALVAYSKHDPASGNTILCVVNTNPHADQWGECRPDVTALGVQPGQPFDVHDLLTDDHFTWHDGPNTIGLSPAGSMAHIFRVKHAGRTEADFDTYN